jgi:hypothetical protein
MGRIVFGGAMSHVLDPDYYRAACGELGRYFGELPRINLAAVEWRLS